MMITVRPEPVLSVRQRRLMEARPPAETVRQKAVIELSDRMQRGFKKNAQRIAKQQGVTYDKAAAILAASTRRASAAAKRRNPRLNKVKGKGDNK